MKQLVVLLVVILSFSFLLLGAAKDAERWISLFDGKTLTGWRTLDKSAIKGWRAENGVLHFNPKNGRSSIYTDKEYANFILELEWKFAGRGNSGIKYRMQYYGRSYLGPEYQLLSAKQSSRGKGATAALYDLIPVDTAAWKVKPDEEWNRARIVANGPKIEHWLNGKKVVAVDVSSETFKEAIAKSKFRKYPHYAQNKAGRIMLQDHGGQIWFRNIRIKILR